MNSTLAYDFPVGVATAHTAALPTTVVNNFVLEAWVRPESVVSNAANIVYNGSQYVAPNGWGFIRIGNSYRVSYAGVGNFGNATAAANVWAHLALVRDNGVSRFYVNGALSGTTNNAPITPGTSFGVNNYQGGCTPPAASTCNLVSDDVDEVRVWTFAPGTFAINSLLLDFAEIGVEQPVGTNLNDFMSLVSFGSINQYTTTSLSFTVRNTGNAPLTGLGISIDGASASEFTVTANPSTPVPAGGSTSFTVRFAPLSVGLKSAVLHIASNDRDENPFDISLSGTGTNSGLNIAAQQIISGNGVLEPNECNQLNVTLSNSGNVTLSNVSATLSSSDPNVTITQATVAYPDIPGGSSRLGNMPFELSTGPALVCGSKVGLSLNVSYTGANSPFASAVTLPVGAGLDYVFSSGTSTIPAGGTLVSGSAQDDALIQLTVPSGFQFASYGASTPSLVRASTNGTLQFDTSGSVSYANGALPSDGAQPEFPGSSFSFLNTTFMPYWDDLDLRASDVVGGGIYTQLIGSAPNRNWIIEWRGELLGATTNNISVDFAVVFFENTNNFAYIYKATGAVGVNGVNGELPDGATATIGVQAGTTGPRFTQFSLNTASVFPGLSLFASIPSVTCASGAGMCGAVPVAQRGLSTGSITLPATIAGSNNATRVRFPQAFPALPAAVPVVVVQADNVNSDPPRCESRTCPPPVSMSCRWKPQAVPAAPVPPAAAPYTGWRRSRVRTACRILRRAQGARNERQAAACWLRLTVSARPQASVPVCSVASLTGLRALGKTSLFLSLRG